MITVIDQTEWQGHQLVKQLAFNQAGEPVPFLAVLPAAASAPFPCIVALHGYTSSKAEWLEMNDYTKGGNLVKALADSGYAVVAIDLYAHGENHTETPVDYDELAEHRWEEFLVGSVKSIETVTDQFVRKERFDQKRLGFLSYSRGGSFGFWLANRNIGFKTLVTCVPPVDRDRDDQYSPFNNLANLAATPVLILAGEEDEYIPFEDSKWLYDQLPMSDKQFVSYQSGHSLPLDYVPVAAEWFKQRL